MVRQDTAPKKLIGKFIKIYIKKGEEAWVFVSERMSETNGLAILSRYGEEL